MATNVFGHNRVHGYGCMQVVDTLFHTLADHAVVVEQGKPLEGFKVRAGGERGVKGSR